MAQPVHVLPLPVNNKPDIFPMEVNGMPYGFGRGGGYGRGYGGGMGYGFRGSSPPWPYIGRGRGGLPRCGYFTSGAGAPGFYEPSFQGMQAAADYPPYTPPMSGDEALSYLKDRAEAIKNELEEISSRINDLDTNK